MEGPLGLLRQASNSKARLDALEAWKVRAGGRRAALCSGAAALQLRIRRVRVAAARSLMACLRSNPSPPLPGAGGGDEAEPRPGRGGLRPGRHAAARCELEGAWRRAARAAKAWRQAGVCGARRSLERAAPGDGGRAAAAARRGAARAEKLRAARGAHAACVGALPCRRAAAAPPLRAPAATRTRPRIGAVLPRPLAALCGTAAARAALPPGCSVCFPVPSRRRTPCYASWTAWATATPPCATARASCCLRRSTSRRARAAAAQQRTRCARFSRRAAR